MPQSVVKPPDAEISNFQAVVCDNNFIGYYFSAWGFVRACGVSEGSGKGGGLGITRRARDDVTFRVRRKVGLKWAGGTRTRTNFASRVRLEF
jgi:hypothetical protein